MAREIDEAWIEEAVERYRRIDALQSEYDKAVQHAEVTVRSADGLVELRVAADGTVRDVVITGTGRGLSDLARAVREAVTGAADAAEWARRKLHTEIFAEYRPLGRG